MRPAARRAVWRPCRRRRGGRWRTSRRAASKRRSGRRRASLAATSGWIARALGMRDLSSLLKAPQRDLARQRRAGEDDEIVRTLAPFVGDVSRSIIGVVGDLVAARALEFLQRPRIEIIGERQQPHDFRLGRRGRHERRSALGERALGERHRRRRQDQPPDHEARAATAPRRSRAESSVASRLAKQKRTTVRTRTSRRKTPTPGSPRRRALRPASGRRRRRRRARARAMSMLRK